MVPLNARLLLSAYAAGIFPMAEDRESPIVHWIEPRERGVLSLDRFHVPRRLRRTFRQRPFEVTVDTDFDAVIRFCAEPTPGRPRTWLNDDLIALYNDLHRMGHAHSVECRADGQLVGGLYGVSLRAAFFGESMFSRRRDASKVALVELVARLRRAGYHLLDAQFITAHLEQFGALEIPRQLYRRTLAMALRADAAFPRDAGLYGLELVESGAGGGSGLAQSITQTS
jgi:leucyl/phenylalanyl-tRNA---protein transferase